MIKILNDVLLYVDLVILGIIIFLGILIIIRTTKYIKLVDKNGRDKIVKYIRKTSKFNKEPRKRLKF